MTEHAPIDLWEGTAPGSELWDHEELDFAYDFGLGGSVVGTRNVVVPTVTGFIPAESTDRAVIVCPGGALHFLSMEAEGRAVVAWLENMGVAAYLLKYRIVPTPADEEGFAGALRDAFGEYERTTATTLPLAAADAERAIQVVRGQGYRHVTLLGFSAGGIVSAEVVMRSDADGRPDAAAIVYAPSIVDCRADAAAPPLFVAAATDDELGIQGSLDLYAAWREAGRPVELHLFERGGHGFGMGQPDRPVRVWPDLFWEWLNDQ